MKIMDRFLNISTLFNHLLDRDLKDLSSVYSNLDKLGKVISETIGESLSSAQIKERKILLKPNWVKHSSKITDDICLRTNDNFLLAALEVILEKSPSSVIIGDAPIQGCRWNETVTEILSKKIHELSKKYQIPVQIKDLRRATLKPLSDYVIFNLKDKSYLEPITSMERNRFRVTNYDPSKLVDSHKHGTHKYCVAKELFEADVIISMPKIKTHQKSGITGALKNIVGLNGDKDFLPHHRLGGTGFGGDCYPGKSYLRYCSELALDMANAKRGTVAYFLWTKVASLFWRLSFPKDVHSLEAGWYGNDTTWRMVMDLNLIAFYGKPDGSLSDKRQRCIYSLCDGIIAGQGNGPLNPEPLPLGIVSFTDSPEINDIAMAILMGFDYRKLPLLTEAAKLLSTDDSKLFLNSKQISLFDLNEFSIKTNPPQGWKSYLLEE
jgi:uncharacterized protein (DUF362 family)